MNEKQTYLKAKDDWGFEEWQWTDIWKTGELEKIPES